MNIPKKIKDPWSDDGYGAHKFACCNTIGGSVHSYWSSLFYHKGVFIGYCNYNWYVGVSSDPKADWRKGDQNSRAWGNCMPRSKTAKLMSWAGCEEEVKAATYPLILEAITICNQKIEAHDAAVAKEQADEAKARQDAEQVIVDAWTAPVHLGVDIGHLEPFRDGDKWCVLLGDNLQEGIAGFGDTPEEARQALKQAIEASK